MNQTQFPTSSLPLRNHRIDVASAMLFYTASSALAGLFAFIAHRDLGASTEWVGVMGAAVYAGYLTNVLLTRVISKLTLKHGLITAMLACACLTALAAVQKSANAYCVTVVIFFLLLGLYEVIYYAIVPDLYDRAERPRRLSLRQLAISAIAAFLAVAFGNICSRTGGHTAAFLIASMMMVIGAAIFGLLRGAGSRSIEPVNLPDIANTVWHNSSFRRAALILTMFGWVGAGVATLIVLVYQRIGFDEKQVGQLVAARIAGAVVGFLVITPRMRFAGGISNFRLCFLAATAASVVLFLAGTARVGPWTQGYMAIAEVLFGISGAVFALAVPTAGLNLARGRNPQFYVNALMIVLGVRGMIAPIIVANVVRLAGTQTSLIITVVVAFLCVAAELAQPSDAATHSDQY